MFRTYRSFLVRTLLIKTFLMAPSLCSAWLCINFLSKWPTPPLSSTYNCHCISIAWLGHREFSPDSWTASWRCWSWWLGTSRRWWRSASRSRSGRPRFRTRQTGGSLSGSSNMNDVIVANSIRRKHNVGWQHLTRMKDRLISFRKLYLECSRLTAGTSSGPYLSLTRLAPCFKSDHQKVATIRSDCNLDVMILLVIASCLNCQGGSSNILENRWSRKLRGISEAIAHLPYWASMLFVSLSVTLAVVLVRA